MPSYFDEVLSSPAGDPRGLAFVATPGAGPVPDDLMALVQEYSAVTNVVSVVFENDITERTFLFDQMLRPAAEHAFCGTGYSVADGRASLASIKVTVTNYAYRIRDARLRSYTWLSIWLGALPLLLGLVAQYVSIPGDHLVFSYGQQETNRALPFLSLIIPLRWIAICLYIVAGATIGVWAEFALRMSSGLSFDQLLNMDPSRWRPNQRVLVTIVVAFVFAFILKFEAVQVGVGNILLNQFAKGQPLIALVIGGVTGIAFPAVRDILYRLKPEERK